MKVIKISPRGYCHGVVYAMNLVANTIMDKNTKKPIYILGEIVHNKNITNAFKEAGAITLKGSNRREILNQVSEGTVIITAHGIDPNLITLAIDRGLNVVDATCSDVYKTHEIIKNKINSGYKVLYIGKKNHPEPEGVIGIDAKNIFLIESKKDFKDEFKNYEKLCITNQTTMSMWDTEELMNEAQKLFPQIERINEICLATQQRQEAVKDMAKIADLTIVVGDPNSNNTNRLVEISEEFAGTRALRIESLKDLDIKILLDEKICSVAVTSGASTPSLITKEVVEFLEQFDKKNKDTWENKSKFKLDRIIPRVKDKNEY